MKITEQFRGIWVIAYRDLLRFLQERTRLISAFAMPILFLIIFGAGFKNVIGPMAPGVDFVQFIYPGIIAMTTLMVSLMSGLSIVWDREFGFLREVLVAPLSRSSIVLGKVIGTAIISLGQTVIMLVLAPFLQVELSLILILKLIPILIIISIAISGLGILMASRMRSQQGFQLLVQIVIMPMTFLSGVLFPVNNVAVWLSVISKLNPLTYGVDAVRQIFLGVTTTPTQAIGVTVFGHTMGVLEDTLIVIGLGIIFLVLAVLSFSKQD
ncbi:MAG: ABC transporter permease [Dehalococcoidales bacterium]|nr:ABC transporter permease [Dehalococcoidales bacterium]